MGMRTSWVSPSWLWDRIQRTLRWPSRSWRSSAASGRIGSSSGDNDCRRSRCGSCCSGQPCRRRRCGRRLDSAGRHRRRWRGARSASPCRRSCDGRASTAGDWGTAGHEPASCRIQESQIAAARARWTGTEVAVNKLGGPGADSIAKVAPPVSLYGFTSVSQPHHILLSRWILLGSSLGRPFSARVGGRTGELGDLPTSDFASLPRVLGVVLLLGHNEETTFVSVKRGAQKPRSSVTAWYYFVSIAIWCRKPLKTTSQSLFRDANRSQALQLCCAKEKDVKLPMSGGSLFEAIGSLLPRRRIPGRMFGFFALISRLRLANQGPSPDDSNRVSVTPTRRKLRVAVLQYST